MEQINNHTTSINNTPNPNTVNLLYGLTDKRHSKTQTIYIPTTIPLPDPLNISSFEIAIARHITAHPTTNGHDILLRPPYCVVWSAQKDLKLTLLLDRKSKLLSAELRMDNLRTLFDMVRLRGGKDVICVEGSIHERKDFSEEEGVGEEGGSEGQSSTLPHQQSPPLHSAKMARPRPPPTPLGDHHAQIFHTSLANLRHHALVDSLQEQDITAPHPKERKRKRENESTSMAPVLHAHISSCNAGARSPSPLGSASEQTVTQPNTKRQRQQSHPQPAPATSPEQTMPLRPVKARLHTLRELHARRLVELGGPDLTSVQTLDDQHPRSRTSNSPSQARPPSNPTTPLTSVSSSKNGALLRRWTTSAPLYAPREKSASVDLAYDAVASAAAHPSPSPAPPSASALPAQKRAPERTGHWIGGFPMGESSDSDSNPDPDTFPSASAQQTRRTAAFTPAAPASTVKEAAKGAVAPLVILEDEMDEADEGNTWDGFIAELKRAGGWEDDEDDDGEEMCVR
ncbi:uncharacterized protein K452DRAFT_360720 [Aplosporella prunicola CBS 121167]|uniref:Uncharacterized protein n=1 Tax=Aplosporella prunicola CBS 121167 TaxID=1176127 RepID=A0A6A6B858_9PEZI|nr:uncharacterized protein K452DRAFT_360720 [Aplosporella prunicola CBS 121167]KAF2138971.1 hypothetical protein K452DRAFT_360720 [Aplosporella prunicola CBS 121167]